MRRTGTRRKLRPGRTWVTVEILTKDLIIAKAIAAALTAASPEEPFTLAQVLAGALNEGLIQAEKMHLGTRSLDHSVRPWESEDDYPETTLPMLALVRAISGKAEARS